MKTIRDFSKIEIRFLVPTLRVQLHIIDAPSALLRQYKDGGGHKAIRIGIPTRSGIYSAILPSPGGALKSHTCSATVV